jgi:putative transposase
MSKTRRNFSPEFKSQLVLQLLREEFTVNELAAKHDISPVVVGRWKAEFLENASVVFQKGPTDAERVLAEKERHIADLERKVGQLTIEVDWMKKNLEKSSAPNDRMAFVEHHHPRISVKRQCYLLSVNRSSTYRKPKVVQPDERIIEVMHKIDAIHTAHPTFGYRKITDTLRKELLINRKCVRRLMKQMGIHTIYPKPNLSKRFHAKYVKPYLLRNLKIIRPNQVWGVDITYVKMNKGFMYLFIIIDWYSRYIVDYELSSTLDKGFVMSCLKRAISRCKPEIINSDQGSHFTNPDYINLLEDNGIKISMDGKGQALDNVRTERFFRSIKYDDIYINDYSTPKELRKGINTYMHMYNTYRPHDSLDGDVPANFYFSKLSKTVA